MFSRVLTLVIHAALALVATASAVRAETAGNVVLVIADGLTMELITVARIYQGGAQGKLALEKLPHTAFVRTHSTSDLVTDSAAAATALARGRKAVNRAVGVTDPPMPSILEIARNAGWSTAVVTDDSVTGGTSTPFLIEHPDRGEMPQIARKLIAALDENRADILAGGGSQWFLGDASLPPEAQPILEENAKALAEANVRHLSDWEQVCALEKLDRPVLATFWPNVAPYYADSSRSPRLRDMTEQVIRLLRTRSRPFMLVIEAALPDKASHQNQARRAITEVLELDATIDWLLQHLSKDSLLLVTTDHGTGGLAFNGYLPVQMRGDILLGINPATGHSILTWASGPGGPSSERKAETKNPEYAQPSLIQRPSAYHTGGDAWLLGHGPGSEAVHGFMDNTAIYDIMKSAIVPIR